jgi:hypothetical protein
MTRLFNCCFERPGNLGMRHRKCLLTSPNKGIGTYNMRLRVWQLQGRFAIICRALYGLKPSGAAWHSSFAGTLNDLGFTSSLADPDVWMQPANKQNCSPCYEYIYVYVDDLYVISESAK